MSFLDILRANMDFSESERKQDKSYQIAENIFTDIQNEMISEVHNHHFRVEHGVRIVQCTVPFPDGLQYLDVVTLSEWTDPVQQRVTLVGKSKAEARKLIRRYGANYFCNSSLLTPPQKHKIQAIEIDKKQKGLFDAIIDNLKEMTEKNGIRFSLKVVDYFGKEYQLPYTAQDMNIVLATLKLQLDCTCTVTNSVENKNKDDSISTQRKSVDFDALDGLEFEKYCARILAQSGYVGIQVTPGSNDQGIDIIATKDGIKYGIQCKCYSSDIGNKAVQEAYAGKSYYNCHVGVVLTNRFFTQSARNLAEKNGVLLWDRDKLIQLSENLDDEI